LEPMGNIQLEHWPNNIKNQELSLAFVYFLSTMIVQFVTRAARAPTAANTGANAAPTTPTVKGNSTKVSSFSFFIIIRRAFPSFISWRTFSTILSPDILYSSLFCSSMLFVINAQKWVINTINDYKTIIK